jgi:hypothetical protein
MICSLSMILSVRPMYSWRALVNDWSGVEGEGLLRDGALVIRGGETSITDGLPSLKTGN